MVNIQDTCCLDINFDDHEQTVHFGQDVYPSYSFKVPLRNIIPSLLNKSIMYPEIVYEEYKQVYKEADRNFVNHGFSFDLLLIPAGLLGIEFIKTHIFYAPLENKKFSTVVEVHFGILTVIMQKNKPRAELDFDTCVGRVW